MSLNPTYGCKVVAYPCGCEIQQSMEDEEKVVFRMETCDTHHRTRSMTHYDFLYCPFFNEWPPTLEELDRAQAAFERGDRYLAKINSATWN